MESSKHIINPIFHQAFFCRVGADNAIIFAIGAFQTFLSPTKLLLFKVTFAHS